MNKNMKLFTGIILFGSLWGFSECIIGPWISNLGAPSGVIMTGLFAMIFLTLSRLLYKQKGMQISMGLVAGALRFFNPFGGCQVCSAIAIIAEGFIFETIWNLLTAYDLKNLQTLTNRVAIGVFTSYSVYVLGYLVTQILTPISYGLFNISDIIIMMPQYLARGLPAGLIGAFSIPIAISISNLDLKIKDRIYYPTTAIVTAFCWVFVIGNWLIYSI